MIQDIQEIQIIGAGFGRTGTLSLKEALEVLGFAPCYHMHEVFEHPEHVPIWSAATRGEVVNWRELLAGFHATVDWPSCAFYEQLMQVYPDAKVLLSVRDPERWYESVSATIYQISKSARSPLPPAAAPDDPMLRNRMYAGRLINALVWQKTFHDRFEDKNYALSVYEQHIEEVKQRVPSDKLLVFDVKEGWEPLCTFLGVDIPQTPFPHLNDRAMFDEMRNTEMKQNK